MNTYFNLPYSKKVRVLSLGLLILIIAALGVTWWTQNRYQQENPIPDSIKQEVDYGLYYPAKLSDNFHFDDIAFDQGTGVVTYKYSSSNATMFFSLQKKPDGLNYEEFRNKQMTGVRELETPLGTAYSGTLQNQTIASLLTENSWILVTAGSGTNIADLELAVKSLVESK